MSERAAFWLVILVLATGTLLLRSLPIWLHGTVPTPRWLQRLLRHVPAAALTALVVPGSLYTRTDGAYAFAPARILAAAFALLVAWRTKNMAITLVAGMLALWAMQAAMALIA
ncbi:MAG: AzlD domain-containing protein [Coriobacteriia bacterium]|nr:AzlD domain-containing protein [Coriobacteriia bacterium]